MSLDSILTIANASVLPAWLLLIVAPRWKWSARLICGALIPLLLALLYSLLIFWYWGNMEADFGSVAGISSLFQQPGLMVAGWVHYLAFDLFIGSWEVRDSQRLCIPHWLVVPCLLLTLLLGPMGLGLYLVVRFAAQRQPALES